MKRILFILFLCCIGSGLAACQDEDHTVPTLPSGNDPDVFSRHTGGDKTLSAAALDRTVLIRIAELFIYSFII